MLAAPGLLAVLLGWRARSEIRASSGRLTGTRLARAGITLGVLCILFAPVATAMAFVHAFGVVQTMLYSRTRPDMRSLAVAIEAYHVDNKVYPAWAIGHAGPGRTRTYNDWIASQPCADQWSRVLSKEPMVFLPFFWHTLLKNPRDSRAPSDQPGFLMKGQLPGQQFWTLTTPQAYIPAYPLDCFSPVPGATFVYWSVTPGAADPSGRSVGKEAACKEKGGFWYRRVLISGMTFLLTGTFTIPASLSLHSDC